MYHSIFTNHNVDEIVSELKLNGFYIFNKVLEEEYINQLLQEIDFDSVLVNTNDVGVVTYFENQYLTHCLAHSKKVYDIVTSQKILDICDEYFSNVYRLTNHRVYKTKDKASMPWHTDNNLLLNNKFFKKHDMPGLLFLFYLSNVTDSPFQLVRKSHTWSEKFRHEIYISETLINNQYKQDILTLPMEKGSLIICDTHTIHRAQPFKMKGYSRYALIFQIDQVSDKYIGHGEKNIVNTEYLDNLNSQIIDYLGFGLKKNDPAFPRTSISTMTLTELGDLQKNIFTQAIKSIGRRIIVNLVPPRIVTDTKRIIWNFAKGIKR